MSEALATVDATRALEPANLKELADVSRALAASGLLGRDKSKAEACFAVIMAGRELGLTAMASLRSIHVIEGKTVLSSDLIVALVKRSPDCEFWRVVESTDAACTIETKRRGDPVRRLTWTIDQARVAGLTGKDVWKKYPRAMLRARCSTELAREVHPESAHGLYDPDELQDRAAPEARAAVYVDPRRVAAAVDAHPNIRPAVIVEEFVQEAIRDPEGLAYAQDLEDAREAAALEALKQQIADADTTGKRKAVRDACGAWKVAHPEDYDGLLKLYGLCHGAPNGQAVAT